MEITCIAGDTEMQGPCWEVFMLSKTGGEGCLLCLRVGLWFRGDVWKGVKAVVMVREDRCVRSFLRIIKCSTDPHRKSA